MSEGLPVEVTCRVVGVSVSGFYMWRHRKPSPRSVRHAMVAEVIRQVHAESRQTYGARVHGDHIALLGGAVVESSPENVERRTVSNSFLYNATRSMFEDAGFTCTRQLGKNAWLVSKRVRAYRART